MSCYKSTQLVVWTTINSMGTGKSSPFYFLYYPPYMSYAQ